MTGNLEVWKTISIGGDSKRTLGDTMCHTAEQENHAFSPEAVHMIYARGCRVLEQARSVDLVRLSPRDLGLADEQATIGNIHNRAFEFGLGLCPGEVGPRLRLEYPDQPKQEYVYIGMKPIWRSGFPLIFTVSRHQSDHLCFGKSTSGPGYSYDCAGVYFVFVKPRSSTLA